MFRRERADRAHHRGIIPWIPVALSLLFFLTFFPFSLEAESWNILVYMAADNNLYSNALLDFESMEKATIPSGVKVYLQTDFPLSSDYPGSHRWKLSHDPTPGLGSTELSDLGTLSSGNPQTLRSFVQWGLSRYDADRTMLIIWSHGDSWYKDSTSKWICPDDDAEEVLSVSNGDLKSALIDLPRLDILLFDACSMQTIEVLTEVLSVADYVIGSEDLVPDTGFPYEEILPLFSGSLSEILYAIPGVYTASYAANGSQNPYPVGLKTTCSTISTGDVYYFNSLLRNYCYNFTETAPLFLALLDTSYGMNTGFCEFDLRELLSKAVTAQLDGSARFYLEELQAAWQACVVRSSAIMYDSDIGTAVIWFPWFRQALDNVWRIYHNLDFRLTGWLSFLNRSWGEDETAPSPPVDVTAAVVHSNLLISFPRVKDFDFLYYNLVITNQNTPISLWLPETVYSPKISFRTRIDRQGSYMIYAFDDSGNSSVAYMGTFGDPIPEPRLTLIPNPVRDRSVATLFWTPPSTTPETAELSLYNLRGQQLASIPLSAQQTAFGSLRLDALPGFTSLSSGQYLLKLSFGGNIYRAKLLLD